MNTLLDIKDLSIAYSKKTVVKNFNLKIKKGEIVAIVGESGSGKTSVARAIINILPETSEITSGEILFENNSILKNRICDISFVFQNSGAMLNPIMTIGNQYIEYIKTFEKLSKKDAFELAVKTLEKVNLPDAKGIMSAYPFELSGGMQQRVGIAMAITFSPKLIIADEPTSALDVTTALEISNLLKDINDKYNSAMIIVTHNLAIATLLADTCVVMKEGKIVEFGEMTTIIKNPKNEYTKLLIDSVKGEFDDTKTS